MYLKIGATKLLIGQYGDRGEEKLEINFEYLFNSHHSYRRFAQIIADTEGKTLKIKVKSEFKNPVDCAKLSQLMIGVQKLIAQDNLQLINKILESSNATPQDFVQQQAELIQYFR